MCQTGFCLHAWLEVVCVCQDVQSDLKRCNAGMSFAYQLLYLLDATGFYSFGLHALGIHVCRATGQELVLDLARIENLHFIFVNKYFIRHKFNHSNIVHAAILLSYKYLDKLYIS
jgi:hypothetical protein